MKVLLKRALAGLPSSQWLRIYLPMQGTCVRSGPGRFHILQAQLSLYATTTGRPRPGRVLCSERSHCREFSHARDQRVARSLQREMCRQQRRPSVKNKTIK